MDQQNTKINPELNEKIEDIRKMKNDLKQYGSRGMRDMAKTWFRNLLFNIGNQWISFNRLKKDWDEWKAPTDDYPKPVTNVFYSVFKTLKSLLIQNEPRIIVSPADDTEESIATAEIGDEVVDIVNEESGKKMADEIASTWLVACGDVFFLNYYRVSREYGMTTIPFFKCSQCGDVKSPDMIEEQNEMPTCQCGSQQFSKAIDGQGNEIGVTMPKGKIQEEVISPFDMYFNTKVENFEDVKELVYSKLVPVREIKRIYPDAADKIQTQSADQQTGMNEHYREALYFATQDGGTGQIGGGESESEPMGRIDYMMVMPNDDYPEGIWAEFVNDEVQLLEVLWSKTVTGEYFNPFDHCGCDRVAGRFYHNSPLNVIAPLQILRNKYESFIELTNMTMGASKWLKSSGITMDVPDGTPNQVIEYDGVNPSDKPERLEGKPANPNLIAYLEMIDSAIERLSGTLDVLKGQLPSGLDTFSGLRLLTERAYSIHNQMIKNWERANKSRTEKKIEIARLAWDEPRKKNIARDNGTWETKQFSKADLKGGMTIDVEEGSTLPKSQAVENAAVADSIKMGLIDIQDPKTRFKVLERLGQADLMTDAQTDIRDAMTEWKEFYDSVLAAPEDQNAWVIRPRKGIDNEVFHYRDAVERAKSDEFFEMPKPAQDVWVEHLMYHKNNLDMQAAQQAAMQGPPKAA